MLSYVIIEVFSSGDYTGIPVAVVDNTSERLKENQMRLISRQLSLPATTFFSKGMLPGTSFRLRTFSPSGRELLGPGYYTTGTWWYLASSGLLNFAKLKLSERSGTFEESVFLEEHAHGAELSPVRIKKCLLTSLGGFAVSFSQAYPKFGEFHPDPDGLAFGLGISKHDIGFTDIAGARGTLLRPRVIEFKGATHLFLPLSSPDLLGHIRADREELRWQSLLLAREPAGVFAFARAGAYTYHVRYLIWEAMTDDLALGAVAAGPMMAYLHHSGHMVLTDGVGGIRVRLGAEAGRDCMEDVVLSRNPAGAHGEAFNVEIMGSGVEIASGRLRIPPVVSEMLEFWEDD